MTEKRRESALLTPGDLFLFTMTIFNVVLLTIKMVLLFQEMNSNKNEE